MSYRKWIAKELEERRKRNSRYSLMAFSRDLDASHASLSLVLSGKRNLSKRTLIRIADRLGWTPEMLDQALNEEPVRHKKKRKDTNAPTSPSHQMREWYLWAILSLSLLENSKADPNWIARRIGIPVTHAEAALSALRERGLVLVENGYLIQAHEQVSFPADLGEDTVKAIHCQILDILKADLDSTGSSSTTSKQTLKFMPLPPHEVHLLNQKIAQFMSHLTFQDKSNADHPNELYALAFYAMPITRRI